jgi:hypothetical protein
MVDKFQVVKWLGGGHYFGRGSDRQALTGADDSDPIERGLLRNRFPRRNVHHYLGRVACIECVLWSVHGYRGGFPAVERGPLRVPFLR